MSNGKRYLEVFTISEHGQDKKSFWTRIGTAFENRDGSLSVLLDALPLNGKLQIREPQERRPQRGDADEGNNWVTGR